MVLANKVEAGVPVAKAKVVQTKTARRLREELTIAETIRVEVVGAGFADVEIRWGLDYLVVA